MSRVDSDLLQKISNKLGLGDRRVSQLIRQKADSELVSRKLAAGMIAAENNISGWRKFFSSDELADLRGNRGANGSNTHPQATIIGPKESSKDVKRKKTKTTTAKKKKTKGNTIFVVHGRNDSIRKATFSFLRSIGLNPLEWDKAMKLTNKGSPYVGEVLTAAFREAAAVLVLLTPDDTAKLQKKFLKVNDPQYERNLTPQARPNVLFEAGMAFGSHPDSTILVQVGSLRPFSDIAGRHIVHLDNSVASRQQLASKLEAAGCNVDTAGTDWHTEGDFSI